MFQSDVELAIDYCHNAYNALDNPYVRGEVIERGNALALVQSYSAYHTVSIAGTNDIEDLGQAASVCGKGAYHPGFYAHSLRIKRAIQKHLKDKPKHTVWLYGHSLGGVCAQYLSLDLAQYAESIKVVSIGAPKGFREYLSLPANVSWIIIENDLDAVVDYPLSKPFDWDEFIDYNDHVERFVYSDRSRRRRWYEKYYELLKPSIRSFSPRFTLDDTIRRFHSLSYYEELIRGKKTVEETTYDRDFEGGEDP